MIVGLFGQTGMGKSTLLKRIVSEADRALVVDPIGKLGHLGVCPRTVPDFARYWERQFGRRWKIVLQPGVIAPHEKPTDVLLPYLEIAFQAAMVGCPHFLAVVDEVDRLGTANVPDPRVRQVADVGRNFGFSLVYAARRPQCVDATLRSQSDTLYLFGMSRADDVAEFRTCAPAAVLAELPKLTTFLAYCCRRGQAPKLVSVDPRARKESVPMSPTTTSPEPEPQAPPENPGASDTPEPGCVALVASECVIGTTQEIAARFGYRSAHDFRRSMLDTGRLPYRRLSRCRIMVRKVDLPA